MCDGENAFEATGALLRGPGNRFRLEMEVKSQQPAHVLTVCDGATCCRSHRIGSGKPMVQSIQGDTLADPITLLRHLRDGLKNATMQSGLWQDLPVVRITGNWAPRDDTPTELRPPIQPRTCHLYLDAQTLWPVRIEWWGASHPHDPPSLL